MSNIRILLAFATREKQNVVKVEVPRVTTLQQGLTLLAPQIASLLNGENAFASGVWGKIRAANYVLREGDRIEFYRPLKADPKQARRVRATQKGQRG